MGTDIHTAVSWTVNGSGVDTSEDGRISTERSALIFSPLTTSDTGSYTCVICSTAHIVIEDEPKKSEQYDILVQSQ